MKKFLAIVVLGLLWCNVGVAKIIKLNQEIYLDVPETHNFISLAYIHYLDKDSTACQAYLLLVKALAKLKTGCMEHKVEKFLNYIGKYRDEKKTSIEL